MAEPIIREYIQRPRTIRDRVRLRVYEMVGRTDQLDSFAKIISSKYKFYKQVPTIDTTRTIYALSRAIFYAGLYADRVSGKVYGKEYLLGAPLGKPIVNIVTAFALGEAPQILESDTEADAEKLKTQGQDELSKMEEDAKIKVNDATTDDPNADPNADPNFNPVADNIKNKAEKHLEAVQEIQDKNPTFKNVNQWLEEKMGFLWVVARNSFRDGDTFVVMEDDGTMTEVAPEDVDIVTDPNRPGKVVGYDIYTTVEVPNPKSALPDKKTYLDEIRITYQQRFEIKDNKKIPIAGTRQEFPEERQLPVVHFSNEREGRQLYGTSEFQGIYNLMANYHALLEAGIKGNIYNSTSVPWVKVDNVKKFMENNFSKDEDGNYRIAWDQDKMLIGGEGFQAQMLQAQDMSQGTMNLGNILFWLIAQNSETPEFAFGTAVQSSKASVSEQTPVLVKKAARKQKQLEGPLRELIDLYIERLSKLKPDEFKNDTQFKIDMPDILDKDLNVNLQIVTTLLSEKAITLKTAMILLNMSKYVGDVDLEILKAQKEGETRTPPPTDIFGGNLPSPANEQTNVDKVKKTLKAVVKNDNTIKEMLDDIKTPGDLDEFVSQYDGLLSEDEITELGFTILKKER